MSTTAALDQKGNPIASIVKVWLMIGLFMIFIQVIVGGITRLTGSGLSITKWEIVTGTIPPIGAEQWEEAFDLYKVTPQYNKINKGMSLSEFKFIYFWEYIHRLWARTMGFVFLIPFLIFWGRGMLSTSLMKNLGVVILIAMLVASFGWIMVASGLNQRPWVNAYKLTIHLSLAFLLYSYLLWTTFKVIQPNPKVIHNNRLKRWGKVITGLLVIQIILGGIMSGMKAALFFPTWPDMNNEYVPNIIFHISEWNVNNVINYDTKAFMPALIQFLHRTTAYILTIIILWYFTVAIKVKNNTIYRNISILLISLLIIQVLLGIFTLLNSIGTIPVGFGVLHQGCALLLLTIALLNNYQLSKQ